MGKVFTHMTMSLDGFIADPNYQVGELFDWYGAGDVTVPTPNEEISFQVDGRQCGDAPRVDRKHRCTRLRPTPVRHCQRVG